jgi:hypothetical protein
LQHPGQSMSKKIHERGLPTDKYFFVRSLCWQSCQQLFECTRHVAVDIAQDRQDALLVETHRA